MLYYDKKKKEVTEVKIKRDVVAALIRNTEVNNEKNS